MNKMIKSLLMMALAVFVGQAFAADPVATWTDFNSLVSGNYTLMADMSTEDGNGKCTVNTDGSITLGGAGLSIGFSSGDIYINNSIVVVMDVDVSGVVGNSGAKLIDITTHGNSNNLYYNPENKTLSPRADESARYGSCTLDNTRVIITYVYDGRYLASENGTFLYIDGKPSDKVTATGLKWTGSDYKLTNLSIPATGMKVYSLRLYSSKLTDQEVNEETNSRFTYVGGLDAKNVVTIGNAINVASEKTVRTIGFLNFTNGENSVNAGGTLEVVSGETTFNAKVKGINGTLTVNKDATFKNVKVDALAYDQSVIVNVYGSLDMGISRWTIGEENTLNLFAGATVSGEGQGQNGALDWYRKSPIYIKAVSDENADSSVTISANLRTRDYGDINFNIEEWMIANVSGDISGNCKVSVEGKGVLKLFGKNTYSGSTTISSEAKVVVDTTGDVPAFSENLEEANGVFVYGTLEFISSKMLYRSFDGDGTIVIKGDVAINNTGDSGKRTGLSRFKGSVIVDEGKKLTLTSWNNPYEITLKSLALNGTIDMYPTGGNGRTVSIKTSRIEGNGNVIHTSQNIGNYIFALLDEAEIDVSKGHVTVESDVTVEGSVTVLGVAGATVLTCANAGAVAAALNDNGSALTGLECVVDGNSIKLAVKQYTIALPEVENATWSYNGQPVSGSVTVAHGTTVNLVLNAADGFEFENGEASIEIPFGEVNGNIAADDDAFAGVAAPEMPEIVGSGVWGGIDWTLDVRGKLTIKPTTDTPVPDVNAPTKRTYKVGEWRETVIYNSKGVGIEIGGTPYDMKAVKKLVIEEGVTMIGSFTCQFPNLTGEVVIPSTVAYIGQEAFHKTPITTLTFAEGGTAPLCIANGAFKKILIEEVSLPKDREYIHVHHWAFGGCPNLKRAFIPGNITKVWGGEHVDYLSNFEAQTNVTWAEYGSLFTGCAQMESITFETEEVRDLFFSNNRNSSDKDYIVAYAGKKAYNSLRAAFDAAENGDKVGPVMNITLKNEWIGDNSAFFTIKDKDIVFDLGGRAISWKGSDEISLSAVFAVEGTGSLTLIDELNKNWKYRGAGTISVTSNGAQVFSLLAAIDDDSSLTINGGTYTLNTAMDSLVYSKNAKTEINAGTFKLVNAASGAKIINTLGENQLQVVVNGGTYNADLNSQELVGEVVIDKDRFACKDNGDGTWSVLPAVAYIAGGSVSYATLEDAFKAVKAGDTIEILDDVTVTEPWNCSEAGARFTVPVTINGNGKTITFTNVVDDGVTNMAALYFEKDAVVNDLTIVMGEPTTVYSLRSRMASTKSAISAKGNLMVDNCAFVGSGDNANAIVYGDGTDGSEGVTVTISNSSFTGWDRGVIANGSDNEVGTVVLDGNTFEGSDVHISASENVTFNNNKMEEGWVDITSYTAQETFMVKATGNDLVANGNGNENRVNAKNVEIQDGFLLPVAEIDGEKYFALQDAVDAAFGGATVKLLADVVLDGTVKVLAESKLVLDLNGKTIDAIGHTRIAIMSYGNLTIKDTSTEQTGTIKAGKPYDNGKPGGNTINVCAGTFTLESGSIYSQNNGILIDEEAATVTINGGTITAETTTIDSAVIYISSTTDTVVNIYGGEFVGYKGIIFWNNTTLNITGGTITGTVATGIQGNGSKDNTNINISGDATIIGAKAGIYHPQGGNMTISGNATITGSTGVVVKGGNVTISGGNINGTGALGGYAPNGNGFDSTGDALYVEHYDNSPNSENYGTPTVTITGGTFVSANGQAVASYANPNGDVEALEKFISGGTFATKPNADYCAEGFTPVKVEGGYSVAVLPDAEVTNLGSITVGLGDYKAKGYMMYDIINGGKLQEATVPYDLTLAMDFKAKDTAVEAAQNAFGNYTTDFFITMSGMSEESFVGNGCYLAGYYPSFNAWVKIPLDGFKVENGKVYPVITSAGFDFKYTDICGTVGQFICGIYLTPEVLAANPNLSVDLTLGLAENKDAALNAQFLKVDNYVYDADDLQPVTLPEVEITDIKSTLTDADPDLTFALNFAIKDADKLSEEYLEKLFAKYGDYYTDYVLTISGLTDPNGSVKFNANGNGDGYLAGQYDAWSKSWVTVPFSDVTVKNGQSFYIMEYAAELMNKGGLRFTLKEIAEIVKNFDCGVYFTPEFLAANPNFKVDLELKVFAEDENGNKVGDISVATNTFDKDDFSVEAAKLDIRIVNGKPQIGFAGEGKLVLNAATALTGEWTKNVEYTAVENDGDDTKTWVTPKDGYYFFKGYIVR